MNSYANNQSPRRSKAYVSVIGTTQMHLRNPFIIAWWSAAFPGLGHLLLSKYVRGFLLFAWEVFINLEAEINLAILYSFTGRFELAKEIINPEWMLLYIPTYIFAIWDSYRTTVDLNHQYLLAAREGAPIAPFNMNSLEINYLDKRTPWVSLVWSMLMPGTGQVYIHRIATAFFVLTWWIVIVYYSKLLPAVHLTFLGSLENAKQLIDPHWLLNLPSVYMFSVYDAYVNTVENNKLYDWEQAKFLTSNYQNKDFQMPSRAHRSDKLYIVSTFEHNKYLELALTAIQMKGIAKEKILSVPLNKRNEGRQLFDSIHHSDGLSLLDLAAVLGTVFMVLGSIYGFVLAWGPLIWGLIGLVFGGALGLLIKFIITKKYTTKEKNVKLAEVVLIIECEQNQLQMVKETLWSHFALGVSMLNLSNDR